MNAERIFVLSGPSGVGKNTLAAEICAKGHAVRAVTATTRSPRPEEEEGGDYFFVNEDEFLKWREEGVLLEWNFYGGNWYGTPLFSVNRAAASGKPVLLVIDVNGALKIRKNAGRGMTLIFILPPSIEALRSRLQDRGDVNEKSVRKRLRIAREEIRKKDSYDHVVVNDDLYEAAGNIERIIAEKNINGESGR